MTLAAFQVLRSGLQLNGTPAVSQVRNSVEDALRRELCHLGVFEDLEVGATDDPDHMLVVLGTYRPHLTEEQVANALEHAWDAVAFGHWESHAFLVDDGHVELQGATMDGPAGRFVTLHLVAARAAVGDAASPSVPVQRSGSTAFAPAHSG